LRSAGEISFRLRQELRNVALWAHPPRLPPALPASAHRLPVDPGSLAERLKNSAFAAEVIRLADQILEHRFPLLGLTVETGPEIHWRRDYLNGKETGLDYFRRIPYLDAAKAGDHKIIWELNRHQHLVLLAQAFIFTGDDRYLKEIWSELESWFAANPFHRGINWSSTLEVAFRALSWVWIDHLTRDGMPLALRDRFLNQLYLHGRHLENNLSFYFSPNTHLLGEAVGLHALGFLYPSFPGAGRWQQLGGKVVTEQMHRQVRDDGSHFEQSTYYHVYALDMFLFHQILAEQGPWYRDKLRRMAEYLHALLGPAHTLPFLGDDDGGRFFHPFGARDEFGRATLATCSVVLNRPEWLFAPMDLHPHAVWWLGIQSLEPEPLQAGRASRLFPDAGIAVMTAGDRRIVADAGPFGPWGSGHSHSDTLSLVVQAGAEDILIDPGTYTYVGDPKWRDWFRGSGAHNTVRIDGHDQATPMGPFRWTGQPQAEIHQWLSDAERDFLDAECRYSGFTHRRRIQFIKPDLILIVDDVTGPPGEHDLEQLWHLGASDSEICFVFPEPAEPVEGWRSTVFAAKHSSYALRIHRRSALPARFAAGIKLAREDRLEVQVEKGRTIFLWQLATGAARRFEFD
jgi:heparinase II/III-like protein